MQHAMRHWADSDSCAFTGCPQHHQSEEELDQMAAELLLSGWRFDGYFWQKPKGTQPDVAGYSFAFTQHAYAQQFMTAQPTNETDHILDLTDYIDQLTKEKTGQTDR